MVSLLHLHHVDLHPLNLMEKVKRNKRLITNELINLFITCCILLCSEWRLIIYPLKRANIIYPLRRAKNEKLDKL